MEHDNVGLVYRSYLPDMMAYGVGLPPYKVDMVVVGYRCNTHSGIAFSEHHLALFLVFCPPFLSPFPFTIHCLIFFVLTWSRHQKSRIP